MFTHSLYIFYISITVFIIVVYLYLSCVSLFANVAVLTPEFPSRD